MQRLIYELLNSKFSYMFAFVANHISCCSFFKMMISIHKVIEMNLNLLDFYDLFFFVLQKLWLI